MPHAAVDSQIGSRHLNLFADHSKLHAKALHRQNKLWTQKRLDTKVIISAPARPLSASTSRPHLAASVAREELGNVAAHIWALQGTDKALRVDADGEGCHTSEGTIVLHTLRGALQVQQNAISHYKFERPWHSFRYALQGQRLTSGMQQLLLGKRVSLQASLSKSAS